MKASECKCVMCGKPAVAFCPVTYRDMQLEQLRQKYAGMAMQAIISNSKYYDECISIADFNSGFADRLIEALYPEQINDIVEDE